MIEEATDERESLISNDLSTQDNHYVEADRVRGKSFYQTKAYHQRRMYRKVLSYLKKHQFTHRRSSNSIDSNITADAYSSSQYNWLFDRNAIVKTGYRFRASYDQLNNKREDPSSNFNPARRFDRKDPEHVFMRPPNSRESSKFRRFLSFLLLIILILALIFLTYQLIELIKDHRFNSTMSQYPWAPGFGDHPIAGTNATSGTKDVGFKFSKMGQSELDKAHRWVVSGSKCHIPQLNPWHNSIEKWLNYLPPLDCQKFQKENSSIKSTLTYVKSNKLYFVNNGTTTSGLNLTSGQCCYAQVTREENSDKQVNIDSECHEIREDGLTIPYELISVKCSQFNYTNFHSFVVHDAKEEAALKAVATRELNLDQYYSVVLLGIDTISRLNSQRSLKKTMDLLRDKYAALEFKGYNKVGENTFPNLIPFLTGLTPEQLTEIPCWMAKNYTQENDKGDEILDNCKFLWNFFKNVGYKTYFSEDWPTASTFNYLKQGFKNKPTDYYGRPFMIARDDYMTPYQSNGCTKCLLDRPAVEVDLDNLKAFVEDNKDSPYFAFHWINCPPHDDINGASLVDNIIAKFFEDLIDLTHERRTFVVFFSDHGYRWGEFVKTRVGHYEASLPMLNIAPPKSFIKDHSDLHDNMKLHQSVLLSPFDMFKTMIDIRDIGLKNKSQTSPWLSRSKRNSTTTKPTPVSIDPADNTTLPTASTTFQQLILDDGITYKQKFKTLSILRKNSASDLDRNCPEAGIPDNYCVCHEFEKVSTSTLEVIGAVYYLVYVHFNSQIDPNKEICHLLDLETIEEAQWFKFDNERESSTTTSRPETTTTTTTTQGPTTTTKGKQRRRRGAIVTENPEIERATTIKTETSVVTTTPEPKMTVDANAEEQDTLPNIELNVLITTEPGHGMFQEVVRFYGNETSKCQESIEKTRKVVEREKQNYFVKYNSVKEMNKICKFSIHSDSISRLNLYGSQSECVKSNSELKKICYCNDLLKKS